MFDNAGEKLSNVAKIGFYVAMTACVIFAFNIYKISKLGAILVIILGFLVFYISSLVICVYGQIAESERETAENTKRIEEALKKSGILNVQTDTAADKSEENHSFWKNY